MTEPGRHVRSELVRIGADRAVITVCEQRTQFVATWRCSCGAVEEEAIQSSSGPDAAALGRASFRTHCLAVHQLG